MDWTAVRAHARPATSARGARRGIPPARRRQTPRAWWAPTPPCAAPARTHSARRRRRDRQARRARARRGPRAWLLHHLELVVEEPRGEHPRPPPLVALRPAVGEAEDEAVHDRGVEADAGRFAAEARAA